MENEVMSNPFQPINEKKKDSVQQNEKVINLTFL